MKLEEAGPSSGGSHGERSKPSAPHNNSHTPANKLSRPPTSNQPPSKPVNSSYHHHKPNPHGSDKPHPPQSQDRPLKSHPPPPSKPPLPQEKPGRPRPPLPSEKPGKPHPPLPHDRPSKPHPPLPQDRPSKIHPHDKSGKPLPQERTGKPHPPQDRLRAVPGGRPVDKHRSMGPTEQRNRITKHDHHNLSHEGSHDSHTMSRVQHSSHQQYSKLGTKRPHPSSSMELSDKRVKPDVHHGLAPLPPLPHSNNSFPPPLPPYPPPLPLAGLDDSPPPPPPQI